MLRATWKLVPREDGPRARDGAPSSLESHHPTFGRAFHPYKWVLRGPRSRRAAAGSRHRRRAARARRRARTEWAPHDGSGACAAAVYAARMSGLARARSLALLAVALLLASPGCKTSDYSGLRPDAGRSDGGDDAGTDVDAGPDVDANVRVDAGPESDAGMDGDAGPSGPTAAELLTATAACPTIAGAPLYALDSGGTASVELCEGSGALWFRADLDIDCDGGRAATCLADPDYLPDTAFGDSTGHAIDANTVPFVVLPGVRAGFDYRSYGLRGGQSVAVIYGDRVLYGVLGDVGPSTSIGEASYAMAEALGVSPSPTTGGIDLAEVTYVFFEGAANRVAPLESRAEAARIGAAAASAFLAAVP